MNADTQRRLGKRRARSKTSRRRPYPCPSVVDLGWSDLGWSIYGRSDKTRGVGIHAELLLLAIATYFVGAIPFGLLVARSRGVDPRLAGSKNIGATNVGRLLGVKFFFVVFFLDFLKSMLPTLLASYLVARQADQSMLVHALWLLVGFAAVLGHTFPVYLKFKGGKGVATSAGVMFGALSVLHARGRGRRRDVCPRLFHDALREPRLDARCRGVLRGVRDDRPVARVADLRRSVAAAALRARDRDAHCRQA